MHLKHLVVGPVIAIREPECCSVQAIKGTWAREDIVIGLGDFPMILLNGAFFNRRCASRMGCAKGGAYVRESNHTRKYRTGNCRHR
jgi:hypothetical protein